jgi:hypothetical protein
MTDEVKSLCDSLLGFDTMYGCRYTSKILKVCAASITDKSGRKKWVTYIDRQNHGKGNGTDLVPSQW